MIAILSLLFVVSMVDRFALGLLVEPLKADLGISDVQLGLLFGSAFALFYGAISIPVARLADRGNRVRLIFAAVIIWSACTIMSGFATSFMMLLVLRIGLALGEAALAPAVYSLIGDAMPAERRTLAGAIFNAFGMAGASGAYILTSGAISLIGSVQADGFLSDFRLWQAVFLIVGTPGILLAIIFILVAREPARIISDGPVEAPSLVAVLRYARSQGWLYLGLFVGFGCVQLATNAFLAWAPTYLSRAFDMSIIEAGQLYGTFNLIAFVSGSLIIPAIGVWLSRRRDDAVVLIGVVCAVVSGLFCVAAILQPAPMGFLVCAFVGLFFSVGGASFAIASLHLFVPPRMRATMVAMMLICLTTLALGVAPPLTGAIATIFGTDRFALGLGMGGVAAMGAVLAIVMLLISRPAVLRYRLSRQP